MNTTPTPAVASAPRVESRPVAAGHRPCPVPELDPSVDVAERGRSAVTPADPEQTALKAMVETVALDSGGCWSFNGLGLSGHPPEWGAHPQPHAPLDPGTQSRPGLVSHPLSTRGAGHLASSPVEEPSVVPPIRDGIAGSRGPGGRHRRSSCRAPGVHCPRPLRRRGVDWSALAMAGSLPPDGGRSRHTGSLCHRVGGRYGRSGRVDCSPRVVPDPHGVGSCLFSLSGPRGLGRQRQPHAPLGLCGHRRPGSRRAGHAVAGSSRRTASGTGVRVIDLPLLDTPVFPDEPHYRIGELGGNGMRLLSGPPAVGRRGMPGRSRTPARLARPLDPAGCHSHDAEGEWSAGTRWRWVPPGQEARHRHPGPRRASGRGERQRE